MAFEKISKITEYFGFNSQKDEQVEDVYEEEAQFEEEGEISTRMVEVTPIRKNSSINISQITTVCPVDYNDARIIGNAFRENIPVIMNLTNMKEAEAKRIVDFASGLTYGLHGRIEKVTAKVFILSPETIEVVDEESEE